MKGRPVIADDVRALLRVRAPRALTAGDLADHVALGGDGLGLDSIAIAEVLLDCEDRFGVRAGALLGGGETVTVGRLIDHFARAPR